MNTLKSDVNTVKDPVAQKFANNEYVKPIFKKEEFYKGGFFAMKKRLQSALITFPNAYLEFERRTDELPIADSIAIMRDYIQVV